MYRHYEDPYKLERQLESLQKEYKSIKDLTDKEIICYEARISELKERINFAYQDEEYDEMWAD